MLKRAMIFGLLVMLLPLGASAYPYNYPVQQTVNSLSEPAKVLREGIELLTGYLDAEVKPTPEEVRKYLEIEILPYFDFERMTAMAIGSSSRFISDAQKRQLVAVVKERFLATLVSKLDGYQQGRIQYMRPKGNLSSGRVSLGVRIYGEQRYPVQIEFKLVNGSGGWKVVDVVANRTSAVVYYRNEFNYLIRRYGVENLVERAANAQ